MEDRFTDIDIKNEKINKIINCSFKEFSNNKFEKASTNNIVKEAGVSRGLLYHYFKDKQELFDFLIYYSMKIAFEEMEQKIDWEESDFLKRLKQSMVLRFDLISRYPYMIEFYQNNAESIEKSKLKNKFSNQIPGFRKKFYEHNIDHSNVKEGTDIKKMINVIRWTIKSIAKDHFEKVKTNGVEPKNESLMKELDIYIEFLRTTFYKK